MGDKCKHLWQVVPPDGMAEGYWRCRFCGATQDDPLELDPAPSPTDLPDAVVEAAARAVYDETLYNDGFTPESVARVALAAASGLWAEQLDAANERPRDRDSRGRWIFGEEAACRFIARTAWPWEATENRDSWAPRIGDEPEFGAKELAAAYRRLDEAAESVGLTPALDAALARNAELEAQLDELVLATQTTVELETVRWERDTALGDKERAESEWDDWKSAAESYEAERDALRAELDNLRGKCICNTGPGTDGPEETCPVHGRSYTEWVERGDILQARLDNLRGRVTALADEWGPQSDDGEVRMVIDCANAANELRAIVRGGDEVGTCTCGESVPTVTTPGPCYWAENAPGIQSQVHCPPPDEVAR